VTEITSRATAQPASTEDVIADLRRFQDTILSQLAQVGLPVDGVVVDLNQRQTLLRNLDSALQPLAEANRSQSLYISKMVLAGVVGLFDAALNYLWDETVNELRRRVADYDLGYFYDIAISGDMRKHFSNAEDLVRVQDVDLLRACREISLLSDDGYKQVDLIRYMRNHASAAHPNQVELTGLQLAGWLETCIRMVITLPLDWIAAHTGRLLKTSRSRPWTRPRSPRRRASSRTCRATAPIPSLPGCSACTRIPSAPQSWLITSAGCGRNSGPSSAMTRGTGSASSTADLWPAPSKTR
jgi:hypothetical protein